MHLIWPLSPLSDSSCTDDGVTEVMCSEDVKFLTDDKVGEKGFASADRVVSTTESDGTGVVSIPVSPVSGIGSCDCLDDVLVGSAGYNSSVSGSSDRDCLDDVDSGDPGLRDDSDEQHDDESGSSIFS